jgi:hypothetical protein
MLATQFTPVLCVAAVGSCHASLRFSLSITTDLCLIVGISLLVYSLHAAGETADSSAALSASSEERIWMCVGHA